ncbi:unnamed protein product [Chondrus crispus]|uniref:Importin N-terminal domain-containing protein n=1 Tax=Chondrus crispus TaxID=2769 RepID=R7QBT8_CHOCR|nr:unnamed protein product [Chondrus crispus]CDF35258.1 unnamed protein product [Chondrus crispus]|eukprot:XP_005715077.1 unnamed protein product [Chondrus crispus]
MTPTPSADSVAIALSRLTVPDTNAVRQAERNLEALGRSPSCIEPLTHLICSHPSPSIRQLAAVMLRRYLPDHWPSLPPPAKASIRAALIPRIPAEPAQLSRKAIVALACDLCSLDDAIWPELLQLVATLAAADNPDLVVVAFAIVDGFVDAVNDLVVEHIPALAPLLAKGMEHPVPKVRVAAFHAFVACAGPAAMAKGDSFPALEPHIPKIVAVATGHQDTRSDEFGRITCGVFEVLALVMEDPAGPLIRKYFESALEFAERMFVSTDVAPMARAAANEFLVGSATVRPKHMRKLGAALRLVQSACKVIFDNAAFAGAPSSFGHDDDDPDEDEVNAILLSLRLLDAMARRPELSKLVFTEVMSVISRTFEATQNAPPEHRDATVAAGYRIIGAICRGCTHEVTVHARDVLTKLANGAHDANAGFPTRARAIEALGLACEALDDVEMPDEELEDLANISLTAILHGMRDPELFVNRHACMALEASVSLFRDDTTKQLRARVAEIIHTLSALSPEISVEAITAVGVLAEHAVSALLSSEMFKDVVEGIVRLISQTGKTDVHARVAALEAAGSLVSNCKDQSVIERFSAQAISCLDSDDPSCKQAAYSFFERMADSVGGNVVAVFGVKVLTSAIESIENHDTIDPTDDDDDEGVSRNGLGPSNDEDARREYGMYVRTSLLEEKTLAVHCVGAFASATTTDSFMKRMASSPETAATIRSLLRSGCKHIDDLTFSFHEEIRAAAYRAHCRIIGANVMLMANRPELAFGRTELTTDGFSRLAYGAMEDSNVWVTATVLKSLATFIELISVDMVAEHKTAVTDVIRGVLASETACQEPREYDSGDEHFTDDADIEGEDMAALIEAVGEVVEAMAHSLRGFFADDFPSILSEMLEAFFKLSRSPRSRGMVFGAVAGVLLYLNFDKCTNFTPPAPGGTEEEFARKVTDNVAAEILPVALNAIKSMEGKILQRNAVFLAGVIFSKARASNEAVWARLPEALQIFQKILVAGNASDGALIDNVAGAVARILSSKAAPRQVLGDPNAMLQAILNVVPLHNDPTENTTIARTLISVAQSNFDILVSAGQVQKVVSCLVSAALISWEAQKRTEQRIRPDVDDGDLNDRMTGLEDMEFQSLVLILGRIREGLGDQPFSKLNLAPPDAKSLAEIFQCQGLKA